MVKMIYSGCLATNDKKADVNISKSNLNKLKLIMKA